VATILTFQIAQEVA